MAFPFKHLPKIVFKPLSHYAQRYNTAGDYRADDTGGWLFTVSRMNPDMEFCLLIHEITEWYLTQCAGIKEEEISRFDIESGLDDPGASLDAPYHEQHMFAEEIERLMADKIGLDWDKYSDAMDRLSDGYRKTR